MTDATQYTNLPDERYLSRDKRDRNKVIKITGFIMENGIKRHTAEVIINDGAPNSVGRKTTMSDKTLRTRYTKISR